MIKNCLKGEKVMNENTPEKTLENFLTCWKDRNFSKMVKFTQITWRTEKGNKAAKQFLKDFYGIKKLIFFEIKNRKQTHEVFVDIEVIIKYKRPSGIFNKKFTARIICEIEPYQASKNGTWGVNPIGALREF